MRQRISLPNCILAATLVALGCVCMHGRPLRKPPIAAPVPSTRIELSRIGYRRISKALLRSGRAMETVNFADDKHLLVTFSSRTLIKRDPNQQPEDHDRQVHAALLELPGGKIIAETDWRLHDDLQYLWPLTNGRFLLRERSTLRILSPLSATAGSELKPAGTAWRPGGDQGLSTMAVGAEGDVVVVQTRRAPKVGDDLNLEGDPDRARSNRVQIRILTVEPGLPVLTERGHADTASESSNIFNSLGSLTLQQEDATHWGFDLHAFTGGDKELGGVESTCAPDYLFLSRTQFLIESCNGGAERNSMGVLDLQGQVLWLTAGDPPLWPALMSAPQGGRFAVRSTRGDLPVTPDVPESAQVVSGQRVTVLRTADGEELLRVAVGSVMRAPQNFAISPGGRFLAVWQDDAVEVYTLPPLGPKEQESIRDVSKPVIFAKKP